MDNPNKFTLRKKVWRNPGPAGWYFVKIGKREAARIRFVEAAKKVGLGYIRVEAAIGKTTWSTTLFPTKEKEFLLAIKAGVRKAEAIEAGRTVEIEFTLILESDGKRRKS